MPIVLDDFRTTEKDGVCRVRCRVHSDGFPETLWFETDARFSPRSAADEPNWALVAVLYPAMLTGQDVRIEANLSPRLFAALQEDAQRLLRDYDPRTSHVRIAAAGFGDGAAPSGNGVATGFSAGTDSFATIARYGGPEMPPSLRLTHLFVNDVGAMGRGEQSREIFKKYIKRSEDYAREKGWNQIWTDSNVDDFYPDNVFGPRCYQRTHTIRNAACALMFEDQLRYYLYSSTFDYSKVSVAPVYDMGFIEPIILPLLSTERTSVMSSCAGLRRIEKTALIADLPDAWRLLDVCIAPLESRLAQDRPNCSRCFKCTRCMVNLDILGKLDRFGEVFDLAHYRANRDRIRIAVARHAHGGDANSRDVVRLAQEAGMRLPPELLLYRAWDTMRAARRGVRDRARRAALSLVDPFTKAGQARASRRSPDAPQ